MRRLSRELALQILFQSEFSAPITLKQLMEVHEEVITTQISDYAAELISGVQKHKDQIDSKLQSSSAHWKLERMATVDRNILRVATFEMKFAANPITPNIAINEAVEIAKKYGSADSPGFINGILDQINKS